MEEVGDGHKDEMERMVHGDACTSAKRERGKEWVRFSHCTIFMVWDGIAETMRWTATTTNSKTSAEMERQGMGEIVSHCTILMV